MSLRKAVNDMCRACIYDPIGGRGTWRQQVESCTSYGCPLYPVRPLSQSADSLPETEKTLDLGPEMA